MEDSSSSRSNVMENLSLNPSRFPRDLLTRFIDGGTSSRRSDQFVGKDEEDDDEESEDVQLNLGLSLGGRFGVDKSSGKLFRSSSIAGQFPVVGDEDDLAPAAMVQSYTNLVRTSSLPVETEDEWRKRKELQSLRRMAAKRRRCEKQRISRAEKDGASGSSGAGGSGSGKGRDLNRRGKVERDQYVAAMNKVGSSAAPVFGGLRTRVSGSVESQAGSCSSLSELDSKAFQGSSSCGERRGSRIQSLHERSNLEASVRISGADQKDTSPSSKKTDNVGVNSLENMPCVFTKGEGPNGRTIEGILYKYGKGEEVRIMCVCHGAFHSPAEFVKHAGGTEVAQPLKHIVVNPNASF